MSFLRLVLVGKTGAGKSSAGNTILGKKEFKACVHFNAVTTQCQKREAKEKDRTVIVVDTPGIADLHVSVEEAKDRVAECFPMSAPGPHAFLLVIKLGRFTSEEKRAADVIREVFGEVALKHTIVLFTHGDELEDPDDIKTLLLGCGELTCLLDEVNWRYHVFDNKRNDRTQVIELLSKIDKMVGVRGQYYTSELFQVAEEKRKEKQEEERLRREEDELRQEWYEKPELRILLIGNTTASNRIASKMILKERILHANKERCQKTNGDVLGRRVSVVETPGLSDITKKPKEIMKEIRMCICLTSPGPHAFIIVERSREESAKREGILEQIKDVFGDQALKYVIILAIESSENPEIDNSFDNEYGYSTEDSRLLEHRTSEAPHKHEHPLKHTFEDPRKLKQVTSLLQKIDRMVERNGGSCFTSDMYAHAQRAIINKQNEILEKRKLEINKKGGGKDEFENTSDWKKEMIKARKEAEHNNVFINCCVVAASTVIAGGALALLGAAVGGPAGAVAGAKAGAVAGAKVGAGIAGVAGAAAGGVVGGVYRYELRKACSIQ